MSFIEDIKSFARKRAAELRKLIEELHELGKSQLTLDVVQVSAAGQTLQFRVDVERRAAWALHVELATRITARRLDPEHGLLREALSSLHGIFAIVREILKDAGPTVARGRESLGGYSLRLLNDELAPFLTKWHPRLCDWEHQRPDELGPAEHERDWIHAEALRQELEACRATLAGYIEALAILAGLDDSAQ